MTISAFLFSFFFFSKAFKIRDSATLPSLLHREEIREKRGRGRAERREKIIRCLFCFSAEKAGEREGEKRERERK